MKRTPLRRNTQKSLAWLRKPRKPIPKVGRKKLRERDDEAAFRAALRARGVCEAWWHLSAPQRLDVCGTTARHSGVYAHHVWPEDRDAGRHDPDRGLWLCSSSHRWTHAWPKAAAELGLLRPQRDAVIIEP